MRGFLCGPCGLELSEEHTKLKNAFDNIVKFNIENEATQTDATKEKNSPNYTEEFFPNVAGIFELAQNYSPQARPIAHQY